MEMLTQKKCLMKGILCTCIFVVCVIIIETHTLNGVYTRITATSYDTLQKRLFEIMADSIKSNSSMNKLKESRNKDQNNSFKDTITLNRTVVNTYEESQSQQQNISTTSLPANVTFQVLVEGNSTGNVSSKISDKNKETRPKKTFTAKEAEKIRQDVVDWFTIKNESLKDDRLNRHNFVFTLDSNLCSRRHISVLIVVHSAVQYGSKRQRVRDTWRTVSNSTYTPVVVFMLGQESPSSKRSLQKYVDLESKTHGDIVQGDFVDSYKNLTYKHVMALHWITSHCDDVRTVVKTDDDVLVDVYKLGNFSKKTGYIRNSLYCHVFKMEKPKRAGKWGLSKKSYPFALFPKCCEGMVYVMSMDVVKKLNKASEDMRFFWIDDVFVTGIVALKANVTHTPLGFGHKPIKGGWIRSIKSFEKIDFRKFMFYVHFKDWNYLMKKLFGVKGHETQDFQISRNLTVSAA